jgi:hypothetical protein
MKKIKKSRTKTIKLISIFLLTFAVHSLAQAIEQESELSIGQLVFKIREEQKGKNILFKIQHLETLLKSQEESEKNHNFILQFIATLYSYTGQHLHALQTWDTAFSSQQSKTYQLQDMHATSAVKYVVKQAKKHNLVLINEAHHIAQHRVFTHELLKPLWDTGFKYLAVEALTLAGEELIAKGWVTEESGEYTYETLMVNMLLEAQRIGYKIIAYDYKPSKSREEREDLAADTVYKKTFATDKNAKVLIHVGYSHVKETQDRLAGKLEKLTKSEAFTVSQAYFKEPYSVSSSHSTYNLITTKFSKMLNPYILVSKDNLAWSDSSEEYDVSIIWPRSQYLQGRPIWVSLNRDKVMIDRRVCGTKSTCLVEVYSDKNIQKLPTDRIVIDENQPSSFVYIRSNTDYVRAVDIDGNELTMFLASQSTYQEEQ